jgi:hypothetical protein
MKKLLLLTSFLFLLCAVNAQNRTIELFSEALDSAETVTGTTEVGDYPIYYSVQLSVDTLSTYNDTAKVSVYVYESLDDTDYPSTANNSDTLTVTGATGTVIIENLSATLVKKLKISITGLRGSFSNAKGTIVWSRVKD